MTGRNSEAVMQKEDNDEDQAFLILVFCLLAVGSVSSQTVTYSPATPRPLFTVRMPDGWKFESRLNPRNPALSASRHRIEGGVWFGVWVIKDVKKSTKPISMSGYGKNLITDGWKRSRRTSVSQWNESQVPQHTGTMKMQVKNRRCSM
jgi:hypothetical protein